MGLEYEGVARFQDLTDVSWSSFADEERPIYNTTTGRIEGRTLQTWPWRPSTALTETLAGGRATAMTNLTAQASGTLRLAGGGVLPSGKTVASISFVSGNVAAVTPTNQWFCLVDQSLNVLAKTVDDTTAAWNATTVKTLSISGGYTPASDIAVYLGIAVVAATVPNQFGVNLGSGLVASASGTTLTGTSTTGLTNPASLGATAAAVSAAALFPWAWCSA